MRGEADPLGPVVALTPNAQLENVKSSGDLPSSTVKVKNFVLSPDCDLVSPSPLSASAALAPTSLFGLHVLCGLLLTCLVIKPWCRLGFFPCLAIHFIHFIQRMSPGSSYPVSLFSLPDIDGPQNVYVGSRPESYIQPKYASNTACQKVSS